MTRAFVPLFHAEKLTVVDPHGDVGLVTLWTQSDVALRRLRALDPDLLTPGRTRLAVVANLYGDGLYEMLANLLHNPQVRHLVALGQDLGQPTVGELQAFLDHGVEQTQLLGTPFARIVGTQRLLPLDPAFDADRLRRTVSLTHLGTFTDDGAQTRLLDLLRTLPRHADDAAVPRVEVAPLAALADVHTYRPSQVEAHTVVRARPLDVWEELVVRTMRFGRPVQLAKGPRLELLDVKVVVTEPEPDDADVLAGYGFDLQAFEQYQREVLDPLLPDGVAYAYGNRMRGHWQDAPAGPDTLASVATMLRDDPEARRAYIALWDPRVDLENDESSAPCLTAVNLRLSDGRLHLAATYRSHNLLTAWLQNLYGLMAVQRHVGDAAGLLPGSITVVSHSLTIDPSSSRYGRGQAVVDGWRQDDDVDRESGKHRLREDPHGYFTVSVDASAGEILAQHRHAGVLVAEHRGTSAHVVARKVAADMSVSLVSHALWLGQELATAQQQLRASRRASAAPRLVVLDLGATLVQGPPTGAASQLAVRLGLTREQRDVLGGRLMTEDLVDPDALAHLVAAAAGRSAAGVRAVCEDVWSAQESGAALLPGALEAVTALAGAGLRLALVSNIWRPYLTGVEHVLGDFLDKHVEPALRRYSFREGHAKPSPVMLRRLLTAAGCAPPDAVMVGDSYREDVAPALAEGLAAVWVLARPEREAGHAAAVLSGTSPAPTQTVAAIVDLTPELLTATAAGAPGWSAPAAPGRRGTPR